jgi:nicotinate-nucleotide adenylyltransferase
MKVGLFFGSFNPIHIGHLIIAQTMVDATDLQEVWFVVSPQNPFKKSQSLLHEHDRYHMVELAVQDNPAFRACDIELRMPRPSYTADTLAWLYDKYPKHTFVLIIGEDNLESFPRWKNADAILEQHALYYYPRPYAATAALATHPKVHKVDAPLLDISATFIRENIQKGHGIHYLVTPEVEGYIRLKKFWK